MVADWCILAAQQWQQAYAVHAFVSCQLCAQHFGERRKQVGMVDEVIATAPWRHLARPTAQRTINGTRCPPSQASDL